MREREGEDKIEREQQKTTSVQIILYKDEGRFKGQQKLCQNRKKPGEKKQKYEGEGECRSGVQAGAVGKSV